MIKSVIFDLDGTLIDSMPVWYNVDRIFLAENGIEAPADISEKVKKMSIEDSSAYFIERFNLSHSQQYVIDRIEQIVADQYAYEVPLKPYAMDFLDYLEIHKIPCCIATSTYPSLAMSALERLGINERFEFILEKLGTLPSETAVFEDSLHCIETASQAGFYTVALYDESSADEWGNIVKISDVSFMNLKEAISILSQSPLLSCLIKGELFKIPFYRDFFIDK